MEGVTVYISDFKRSLIDKLSKNFFSEPSQVEALAAQEKNVGSPSSCIISDADDLQTAVLP